MALESDSILITRDHHFTNNLLFPADQTKGIIYIRQGNLQSDEETDLIEKTINQLSLEKIKGKLLTVYKRFSTIR